MCENNNVDLIDTYSPSCTVMGKVLLVSWRYTPEQGRKLKTCHNNWQTRICHKKVTCIDLHRIYV